MKCTQNFSAILVHTAHGTRSVTLLHMTYNMLQHIATGWLHKCKMCATILQHFCLQTLSGFWMITKRTILGLIQFP